MIPDFRRYLAAKRSVDDRALSRPVWERFTEMLGSAPRILDVGCGTGAMAARLFERGLPPGSSYLGIDSSPENIAAARRAISNAAAAFEESDLFAYTPPSRFDVVIAAAFLDLVDLGPALSKIRQFLRPGGAAYFPINYDGLTFFEPAHPLDEPVLAAYHASMDSRPSGGHSCTGRRLFSALPDSGFEILVAGSSDWLVMPDSGGSYPQDEAYFLAHILHFFETSCSGVPGLDRWLVDRRAALQTGSLIYLAHQIDFLCTA